MSIISIFTNNLDNAVKMKLMKWLQGYLSMKIILQVKTLSKHYLLSLEQLQTIPMDYSRCEF